MSVAAKVPALGKVRRVARHLLRIPVPLVLTLALLSLWGGTSAQTEIDLSLVNGDVRVLGEEVESFSGLSVAGGDLNGDGIQDLIIGAPDADPLGRTKAGKVYVIYGTAAALADTFDLSSAAVDFVVFGEVGSNNPAGNGNGDNAGRAVASGDVDGDGIDDLLIGAPFAEPNATLDAGKVYVIYGSASLSDTLDLASQSADRTILGLEVNGNIGNALASGDVSGDGVADVIIGSNRGTPSGRTAAGKVYVVYGDSTLTLPHTFDLASQSADVSVLGAVANNQLGKAVASGDVNGDGVADLVLGADRGSTGALFAGEVYVIYGDSTLAPPYTYDLSASEWDVLLTGEALVDLAGFSVASGDFNRDGFADVAVGAPNADPLGRANAGKVYVVYGSSTLAGQFSLSAADVAIFGTDTGLGISVASVNFDGDGMDDLLIGAPSDTPAGRTNAGRTYLIGGDLNWPATIDLNTTSNADLIILGDDNSDNVGQAVSGGDFNGDGVYDLLVGAPSADQAVGIDAGEVYAVYGTVPSAGLSLPDTTATYNEALIVPVRLDSTNGFKMVEADIYISFDSDLLTVSGVNGAGTLTVAWSAATTTLPGAASSIDTLHINTSTTSATVTTAGTFLLVNFTVKDVRHVAASGLGLEKVVFNGGRPEWNTLASGLMTLVGNDGSSAATVVSEPGDTVRVRVTDPDLNRSALSVDSTDVVITNGATGELETVKLFELSVDDSIFFGTVFTTAGATAGVNNDSTFNTQKGDSLFATYVDSLDAAGLEISHLDTHYVVDPFGDADANGVSQAFDAARILAHAVGAITLTGLDSLAANVDDQAPFGPINAFDAALVVKKRLGTLGRFPVRSDSAANHPQPETNNSVPKAVLSERLLTLVPQEGGTIAVWLDDRSDIVSGDLFIEGVGGHVEMASDLVEFQSAFRKTGEGLYFAFAGAAALEGPGELFRVSTAGRSRVQVRDIQGNFNAGQVVARAIEQQSAPLPLEFALLPNMPNPFNAETAIRFVLPTAANVRLEIFNALGQQVRLLALGEMAAGRHHFNWNGTNDQGHSVASGLYVYRLITPQYLGSRPMLLLK